MDMSRLRIILVDDNLDEIFLTQRAVSKLTRVDEFVAERNATSLFDLLQQLSISNETLSEIVVLLDINMPQQDGFETLRKIRAHPDYADLPVFMYSSSDADSDKLKAKALGCDGYLVKPFDSGAFFDAYAATTRLEEGVPKVG